MTSAISRAANAAHAHGFAKSVKNEAPTEGFEALFAAVANPVATPTVSAPSSEPGKPGESAREDEKKGSASAFELAASMAIVAADAGKNELRAMPAPVVTRTTAESIQTSQVSLPRVASNSLPDFPVRVPGREAVHVPTVPPEHASKSESAAVPPMAVPHDVPQIEAEGARTNSPASNSPASTPDAKILFAKAAATPIVENEAVVANVPNLATPARETHVTTSPEPAAPPQPFARPRVELSPRALAQAAIVEAMRSPGRGRTQTTDEGDAPVPKSAAPAITSNVPIQTTPVAQATVAVTPPVAAAMSTLVADTPAALAKPITVSPAPSKPAASSRAAADILRQRQYALGTDTSPIGDIVPESAATFETLIALRKADGAFEGHASSVGEHESAAPVSSGTWLPNLPTSAASATTSASAIMAPRAFDQAAWSAALAQQVTASAIAAAKETTVRVEPEGLGPIEVRVRVQSEHVDVRFAIEHPVTMNMVRAALPDLERMLAQSGLNLGDAQIAQQNAGQREQSMPRRGAVSNGADDESAAMTSPVESRPRARVGLLDDFV